jgi:acetolactate synthase-1/2/3 large subunit
MNPKHLSSRAGNTPDDGGDAEIGAATSVTGAQSLVSALEAAGVEVVFGIPGGAILPAYDALLASRQIRHILVRHEQGAGHAAEGYALATGRVGVCIATSGPGATNLVTPLADAHMDSVPIVAITGQVNAPLLGTDAFQEADICGITTPITKHSFIVTEADEIAPTVAQAFRLASSGRPGPVLVDISKTALQGQLTGTAACAFGPGYRRVVQALPEPAAEGVAAVVREIKCARRPVLYVGGGVIRARATAELRRLVQATDIPVVTTLMALGALPGPHPRNLGMPGMHGTVPEVAALQQSDLVIALGARFDDRVTGDPSTFAPRARIVHVDIDPAEIGKNRAVDAYVVGDCRAVLLSLLDAMSDVELPSLATWHRHLAELENRYPLGYDRTAGGTLAPQYVLERLSALTGGSDTVITSGVGQHQMWAAQYISFQEPSSWLTSGGLGTMGFGIPAAMGAKIGRPDATVWCVDGDGCFQMTGREPATCSLERIPIKVALINNASLGMVRQLQTLYYDERVTSVDLSSRRSFEPIPDFVKLAEALGCVGLSCETPHQVDLVIEKAMAIDDVPVVIDFRVDDQALVWPSIAAGASNDDIQYARGLAPTFDTSD